MEHRKTIFAILTLLLLGVGVSVSFIFIRARQQRAVLHGLNPGQVHMIDFNPPIHPALDTVLPEVGWTRKWDVVRALGVRNATDQQLAELARLTTLEKLEISGDAVTDEGLKHLYGMKRLNVLRIEDTSATESGIRSLKQAIPGLSVEEIPTDND